MKKLGFYMRGCWRSCLPGLLLQIPEAGCALLLPIAASAIIDRGIPSGYMSRILPLGLALAALGLGEWVCSAAARFFAAEAAARLAANLRRAPFRRAQRSSCIQIERSCSPARIARAMEDVGAVQAGVELGLRLTLRAPLLLTGTAMLALRIDAHAARILAALIPALFAISMGFPLIAAPKRRKIRNQSNELALRIRENLSGAPLLRAIGRMEQETKELQHRQQKLARAQAAADRTAALRIPLTYIAFAFALIELLRGCAAPINEGALTRGNVIALILCAARVLSETSRLSGFAAAASDAAAGLQRMRGARSLPKSPRAPAEPLKPDPHEIGRIDFEDVRVKPRGCAAALLSDLHFSARRGQIIGIVGDMGAGKSALLNLIPRFCDATSGAVRVNGADVRAQDPSALRSRIGMAPRRAPLFRGSIRDNLLWGNPSAGDDVLLEAVRAAQAEDVLRVMGGLSGEIAAFGENLSASQRQRLSIARALVRKPEILILDEATSALNFAAETRLRLSLRQLPYRPTIFLATRRAASVRYADRILVLDDGRIAGDGTHEQLLESCPAYRKLLDFQFQREVSA